MRKVLSMVLVVMLVVSFSAPAYASAGEKFKDGIKTAFMSPKQIPDNIKAEYDNADLKVFGAVGGLFKGIAYTGIDLVTGLFNALTCCFNNE